MSNDIKIVIKRAADIAMNGPITAGMQDSDDAKAVAFHISSRIMALGDELPTADTGNLVSPCRHRRGGETPPPPLTDAPVSASSEGGDQAVSPLLDDADTVLPTEGMIIVGFEAVSLFQSTAEYRAMTGCQGAAASARVCWAAMVGAMPGKEPRTNVSPTDAEISGVWAETHFAAWSHDPKAAIRFGRETLARYGDGGLVDKAPDLQGKLVDETAKTQGFDEWLARKYGGMFDTLGEEEADAISRIVKAVASSAWAAARQGGTT